MHDDLEKRLSESLHASADAREPAGIDLAAARERADAVRRHRRNTIVGAAVLVGVVVVGGTAWGLQPHSASTLAGSATSDSSVESGSGASEGGQGVAPRDEPGSGDDIRLASPDKVNPCGQPLAESVPSQSGLTVQAAFPADAAAGATVDGEVVVTNTSDRRVTGTTSAAPYVTLAENGVTVWHTNGPMIALAVVIDLAPGESMRLAASFEPLRCGDEDELGAFRDDLPSLPAGAYTVSALVPFYPDGARPDVPSPEYVLSEPAAVSLR